MTIIQFTDSFWRIARTYLSPQAIEDEYPHAPQVHLAILRRRDLVRLQYLQACKMNIACPSVKLAIVSFLPVWA